MDDKVLPDKNMNNKVNPLAENTVGCKTKNRTLAYFLQSKRKSLTNEAVKDEYNAKKIFCSGEVIMVGKSEKGDNGGKTKRTSVSEEAEEKKPLHRGSNSMDNIDFGSGERCLNDVSPQGNVEKPKTQTRKRKRGVDREIAKAFLSSLEKGLSKLRPRKEVAFFRKVELSESDFERIIGKRVKIYWSGSRKWFVGRIKLFDNEKKLHKILYDDGDMEELDLTGERFELEVVPGEAFTICSRLGPNLMKKDMGSIGGKVGEKTNEGDSFKVSVTEPVKKYARKKKLFVSEVAKKGRSNQHGGQDTEQKEENRARHMEVDVVLEKVDKKLIGDDINHVENHKVVNFVNGNGETECLSEVAVETDEKLAEAQANEQESNHENEETTPGDGLINGNSSNRIYVSVGNAEPVDGVMIKRLTSEAAKNLQENAKQGNINMRLWGFNCENNHSATKYTPKDASKQTNVVSDETQVAEPDSLTKDENHENLIEKKLKSQACEAAGCIVRDKEMREVNILEGVLGTKDEGGESDAKTLDSQPLSDDHTKKKEVNTQLVTLKNYVRNGHEKVKSNCLNLS